MEQSKTQKNAIFINEMKSIREDIAKLKSRISGSSRETSLIIAKLQEADHFAIERLVDLGLELKLEEPK